MKQPTARTLLVSGIVSAFLSCFCCPAAWAQNGRNDASIIPEASDRHFVYPVFDGVKRVFIHVHSSGAEDNKAQQAALSSPVRRENLEALLMQLYSQRFSSADCTKELEDGSDLVDPRHKYGCNDQPVVLVTGDEYQTPQAEKARKQPGTLNIELQILIDTSFKPPIASLYLIQDRSDPEIPTEFEIGFPYAMPLSLDEQEIHKRLFQYIRWRIH
ncbi:MAG TPA: hypothetical protein VL625_08055 [Patescibacteria group bacterium]|jgi:hypothetical protein|nr:hypothetical protein [Patescibacteria group bacterium]